MKKDKTNKEILEEMEKRFLEISGLDCDLSKFPLKEGDCSQIKNNKTKNKLFGEVFTPLWLVDEMIEKSGNDLIKAKSTLDLCAGYGQFTIRMLRFLLENKKDFDPKNWLKNIHSFSEYQEDSSSKIIDIFGKNINLFIGDAKNLQDLKDVDKGVCYYNEDKNEWIKMSG